jgi:hypothetical protein
LEQPSISLLNLGTPTELTINSTGEITRTRSFHSVDTNGDAASDDLDTINGGTAGDVLFLCAADSARTVVVKDGVDNIQGPGDVTLDNFNDMVMLVLRGTTWRVVSDSDNAA